MRQILSPKHSLESVARDILVGLENGDVRLKPRVLKLRFRNFDFQREFFWILGAFCMDVPMAIGAWFLLSSSNVNFFFIVVTVATFTSVLGWQLLTITSNIMRQLAKMRQVRYLAQQQQNKAESFR